MCISTRLQQSTLQNWLEMEVPGRAPDAHNITRLPGRKGSRALRDDAAEGLFVLAARETADGVTRRLPRYQPLPARQHEIIPGVLQ